MNIAFIGLGNMGAPMARNLLFDRNHLTWLGNTTTQLNDAASRFAALCQQRPPLQDLFHVL